jgi:acyl-CoA thioester hydrolase
MFTDQTLPKELESTAVIRFQDCDPFRHLNNARYIDYFMNARQDQLEQFYDFRIFEADASHAWVVSKTQIAYLTPATMLEQVLIRTRLLHAGESTLVVEGEMYDREGRRLKALSWIEFTFVNLASGRRASHPDELMRFLSSVQIDAPYEPDGFNTRLESVKNALKSVRAPSAP